MFLVVGLSDKAIFQPCMRISPPPPSAAALTAGSQPLSCCAASVQRGVKFSSQAGKKPGKNLNDLSFEVVTHACRTYGKGLIQSVYELGDGSGLVLTVGKYLTPARADIDRAGLRPDFRHMPSADAAAELLAACRPAQQGA